MPLLQFAFFEISYFPPSFILNERMSKMPDLYPYRIFISHAWRYGSEYDKLVSLLNNAPLFNYYNYSAPKEKPLELSSSRASSVEIGRAITNKIANAQVTLVLGGMYTLYHDWMQYEIEESYRMNKPIIAIRPWGQQNMPTYLVQRADRVVGWNSVSIVTAIRELVR